MSISNAVGLGISNSILSISNAGIGMGFTGLNLTFSGLQLTQQALSRIEKLDPSILAFNETYADRALEQAKAVDSGKVTGPLAGVPIAHTAITWMLPNLACSFHRLSANDTASSMVSWQSL